MKSVNLKSATAKAVLLLTLGAIWAPSAFAYKSYHLEGKLYAILCEDGHIYSYSGSAAGISVVAGPLCKDHGGIAAPGGNGNPPVAAATQAIRQKIKDCQHNGVRVNSNTKRCSGRIRVPAQPVKASTTMPKSVDKSSPKIAPAQNRAPAQGFNSTRSNKPRP